MADNEDGGGGEEGAKENEPLEAPIAVPIGSTPRAPPPTNSNNNNITSVASTLPDTMTTNIITTNVTTASTNYNVQQPPVTLNNNQGVYSQNNNHNGEPLYESYFEDSFVGELAPGTEADVDDTIPEDDVDSQDEELHPSTLDFDFDSFGPESFIFTPGPRYSSMRKKVLPNRELLSQEPITPTTSEPPTLPLSQELEQAENQNLDTSKFDSNESQQLNPAKNIITQTTEEIEDGINKMHPNEIIDNNNDEGPVSTGVDEIVDSIKELPSIVSGTKTNGEIKTSTTRPVTRTKSDSPTENYYHQNDSHWRDSYPIGNNGSVKQIDLKVIEPYKKVISHAGYCHHHNPALQSLSSTVGEPAPAIIVFSACYLPDRSRRDYSYVMDHLFLYVLTSLHELIADDYILIYLHNSRPQENNLPTLGCLKRFYHMIDRRLRKNLKALYLVHPTFWLKTIVVMCKPFISSKFSKKLRFIESIEDLKQYLPIDQLVLPQSANST